MRELGDCNFKIVEGANERIQMEAMLASIALMRTQEGGHVMIPRNLTAAVLILTTLFITVHATTPISFQSMSLITAPVMNISSYGGSVFISVIWYGGLQPYDARIYYGQSPNCASDTVLFNDTNAIALPPNPNGYYPGQPYNNWVWVGSAYNANASQYNGYYCAWVNDSQGTKNQTTSALYLNITQYATTSTTSSLSTTTYSTTSTYISTSSYITTSIIPSTTTLPYSTTTVTYCVFGHICGNPELGCAAPGQVYNCPNEPVANTSSTTIYSTTINQVSCGCICSGTCVRAVNGSPQPAHNTTTTISVNPGGPCYLIDGQLCGTANSPLAGQEAMIISAIQSIIIHILRFL
jgi:hypothetical protein